MSEGIYYENSSTLAEQLQDALRRTFAFGMDDAEEGALSLSHPFPEEESSGSLPENSEELGAFFHDKRITDLRLRGIALVAGAVAVHNRIEAHALRTLTGLRLPTFTYAVGFLACDLRSQHRTIPPAPKHGFITQVRIEHRSGFESTDLLTELVSQAEERYPLLDEAVRQLSQPIDNS